MTFETLNQQARMLEDAGRFADAATLYERALQAPGGSEAERGWANYWLAVCLYLSGRYPEALARYAEIYAATHNRPEHHEQAYRAFCGQVQTLRMIHESQTANTPENLKKRLTLIEEGLRWLEDIGRANWRHALLYEKAWTLYFLNERQQMLDLVEEALRLKQAYGGPGYTTGGYAHSVARIAREQGQPERAIRALDAAQEAAGNDPHTRVLLQQERVEALLACDPPRRGEALEAGRRLVRMADEVQNSLLRVKSYGALGMAASAAKSYEEAKEACRVTWEIAMKDETFRRPLLLQDAQWFFQQALNLLEEAEEPEAAALREKLQAWREEMDEARKED